MNIVDQIGNEQLKQDVPMFKAGDTLRVHAKLLKVINTVSKFSKVYASNE